MIIIEIRIKDSPFNSLWLRVHNTADTFHFNLLKLLTMTLFLVSVRRQVESDESLVIQCCGLILMGAADVDE